MGFSIGIIGFFARQHYFLEVMASSAVTYKKSRAEEARPIFLCYRFDIRVALLGSEESTGYLPAIRLTVNLPYTGIGILRFPYGYLLVFFDFNLIRNLQLAG